MSDPVKDFARHLAGTKDDAERARILARAKMLAMQDAPEDAFEPDIRTLGEYLDTPIDIPPSLVWPTIVVRGEITATLGRAGKGKTTMNLNRILKWGCGRPLFDSFKGPDKENDDVERGYIGPDKPVKTLIIENEGSAGMFHQKMGMMLNKCGDILSDEDREMIRENVLIWGDGGFSGFKLDNDNNLNELRAGIDKFKPDIVFMEPFRGLWRGEENSATDMALVVDNMLAVCNEFGVGCIVSHHERKSGAGDDNEMMSVGRGSTVLEGAANIMENFQSIKSGEYREMSWSKARYLPPPPPCRLEYDRDTGWYQYVEASQLEQQMLQVVVDNEGEPVTIAMFCEELDEKTEKVRKTAKAMAASGQLKQMSSEHGQNGSTGYRYRLPSNTRAGEGGADF